MATTETRRAGEPSAFQRKEGNWGDDSTFLERAQPAKRFGAGAATVIADGELEAVRAASWDNLEKVAFAILERLYYNYAVSIFKPAQQ
jgi:hypothetical protein